MVVVLVALLQMEASLQPDTVGTQDVWLGRGTDDSCFRASGMLYWVDSEGGYPYAQVMAKIGEPRYQQKKDCYRQKELAIHDIPFGYFCGRLSKPKYIIRT